MEVSEQQLTCDHQWGLPVVNSDGSTTWVIAKACISCGLNLKNHMKLTIAQSVAKAREEAS